MSETTIPTDGELLTAYLDDASDSSFAELVRRHAALVRGVCRAILRQSEDVDDATQAAFLTLARKAPRLRRHPTIAGWLHRVAWHVSMRARTSRDLRRRREQSVTIAENNDRDDVDRANEARAIIHEQLAAISEKYRVPLVLHHLQGWSETEVATMLGTKVGTVSARLSRGRQMLRNRLERRGLAMGAAAMLVPFPRTDIAPIDSILSSCAAAPERVSALSTSAGRMVDSRRRWVIIAAAAIALVVAIVLVAPIAASRITGSSPTNPLSAATALAEQSKNGEVMGKVLSPDRQPAPNVTIRLYASEADASASRRALATAQTDENGEFVLQNIRPGNGYFLLCILRGPQVMHARKSADVKAGEVTRLGEIVLTAERY